jgi:plasmid stabilization system protein ParE
MTMAASYSVELAAVAARDLQALVEFIAHDNPQAAAKVLNRIEARIAELEHLPARGRVVPELAAFGIQTYRELVASPWRIIYRIADHTVYVLAVVDGRRNLEDILLDRLAP